MTGPAHIDAADLDIPGLIARADEFIRLYSAENVVDRPPADRMAEIRREIRQRGTYAHTTGELTFGAKVAWRNSRRCIGRLYWPGLVVHDLRHLRTAEDIHHACVEHLRTAFNGGRIRPTISVFAADGPDGTGPRIHNPQLIRYAGYRGPDGRVTGDPASADLTDRARALGWPGGPGTRFDVLPLLVQEPGGAPRLFDLPPDAVREVPLHHPDHDWFADLGLRWHALPVISDMVLEIGGVRYGAAPFNGWYMGTEIGARNLVDTERYDLLPEIADRLGLDRSSDRTLWKDRALVELNVAVLWSFERDGITVTDHHTESERFLRHLRREEKAGRSVPADWSWIVPPLSGGVTPVFHRYYDDHQSSPSFLHAPAPGRCPVTGHAPATAARPTDRTHSRPSAASAPTPETAVTVSPAPEATDPLFSPLDPAVLADPYPVYRRLREAQPVYWHAGIDSWLLTRHADCTAILRDSARFSTDFRKIGIPTPPTLLSLQTLDPPDQTPLRHLGLDAVRAQDLDALRKELATFADQLLEEQAGRPSFDFIQDYADVFTLRAITRFIGVEPPETDEAFARFNDDLDHSMDAQLDPDAEEPGLRARAHFNDLVRTWLADPGPHGVLPEVVRRLPGSGVEADDVLVNSVRAFFHAGFEVPSRFLGNAVEALLATPDAWESLVRGDVDLDTAVEELIRYVGPVQALARACTEDTELGGVTIRSGQVVTALIGAANRDPERFPDPETLRLDRKPNNHLGFGRGAHSCLGLNLARIEAQVTLDALLRHPGLHTAGEPVVRPNGTLRGLSRLPLALG